MNILRFSYPLDWWLVLFFQVCCSFLLLDHLHQLRNLLAKHNVDLIRVTEKYSKNQTFLRYVSRRDWNFEKSESLRSSCIFRTSGKSPGEMPWALLNSVYVCWRFAISFAFAFSLPNMAGMLSCKCAIMKQWTCESHFSGKKVEFTLPSQDELAW